MEPHYQVKHQQEARVSKALVNTNFWMQSYDQELSIPKTWKVHDERLNSLKMDLRRYHSRYKSTRSMKNITKWCLNKAISPRTTLSSMSSRREKMARTWWSKMDSLIYLWAPTHWERMHPHLALACERSSNLRQTLTATRKFSQVLSWRRKSVISSQTIQKRYKLWTTN